MAKKAASRKRTAAKKRPRGPKKSAEQQMRQRRALAGVTAVLAFLVAAALFPLQWLGPGAVGLFPEGNPVGSVGDAVNARLLAALGIGVAAVPLGILAAAASVGEWWVSARRKSLWIVSAALLVLGGRRGGGGGSLGGGLQLQPAGCAGKGGREGPSGCGTRCSHDWSGCGAVGRKAAGAVGGEAEGRVGPGRRRAVP